MLEIPVTVCRIYPGANSLWCTTRPPHHGPCIPADIRSFVSQGFELCLIYKSFGYAINMLCRIIGGQDSANRLAFLSFTILWCLPLAQSPPKIVRHSREKEYPHESNIANLTLFGTSRIGLLPWSVGSKAGRSNDTNPKNMLPFLSAQKTFISKWSLWPIFLLVDDRSSFHFSCVILSDRFVSQLLISCIYGSLDASTRCHGIGISLEVNSFLFGFSWLLYSVHHSRFCWFRSRHCRITSTRQNGDVDSTASDKAANQHYRYQNHSFVFNLWKQSSNRGLVFFARSFPLIIVGDYTILINASEGSLLKTADGRRMWWATIEDVRRGPRVHVPKPPMID